MPESFSNIILRNRHHFHQVLEFDPQKERLIRLDLSGWSKEIFEDTEKFTRYVESELHHAKARFGIGGYGENRTLYSRSKLFGAGSEGGEPRTVHLGIDVWGPSGTPVFAFLGGMVHSTGFNNNFGDYGATLILLQQIDGFPFYTLYGHLSRKDISKLVAGKYVSIGETIGHFGTAEENGHWPPHLHFQIILDIGMYRGDYPGVCRFSEKEKWLANCPDPDLILQMMQFAEPIPEL